MSDKIGWAAFGALVMVVIFLTLFLSLGGCP